MPRKATGQIKQEKADKVETPIDSFYQGDLKEAYDFYIKRCILAKNQRNKVYTELDDLTFDQDYILNERAKNSYLKRKKNDDEVRIVTGTTEKKIETVQNELHSMNLQPEVLAYDLEDNELVDLGRNFQDIVKRTGEIERDEDMWLEAVDEILTQRACFIEELYIDKEVEDKKKSRGQIGIDPITVQRFPFRIQRAEKRVLDGRQVYLGDITIPAYLFNTQPYIVKYDRMLYEEAELIYGNWENWDKVKAGMKVAGGEFASSFKYRMSDLNDKEVEVLHYMSYPDDEYQIIINGVMMLKPQTPLPWEKEGYNIAMFVLKSMTRTFAYGKPLTASAKTLQGLNDETIRLLVRKFRQGLEPPMATAGKKVYSKDIWAAGAITQGLKATDFERLIDHNGVTNSELEMLAVIEGLTKEFIGSSDILGGQSEKGQQTARESLALLKQGIKNLGMAVLAVMRMKRDMTYLRIFNVLENYTVPVKRRKNDLTDMIEDVYRKFTIKDAEFEDGKTGKKIVQFMDRGLTPDERQNIKDFSDKKDKKGKPLRIETVNVKALRDLYTVWYVTVSSKEKDGSELRKIMFSDSTSQAAALSQLSGRPLNGDKLIQDFERTWNVKDYFQKGAPGQQEGDVKEKAQELLDNLGGSEAGRDIVPNRNEKPTLNNAEGAI